MKQNKLILVIGGGRSGKSAYAEGLTCELSESRCYVATAPVCDAEMAERIRRHRERRANRHWTTVEEECDLASALRRAAETGAGAALIDSLTVWIGNLMYRDAALDEDRFAALCGEFLDAARRQPFPVVMVIDEVGLGLIPESPVARKFRDLAGRCAQMAAAEADDVYFMIAGIPMKVK